MLQWSKSKNYSNNRLNLVSKCLYVRMIIRENVERMEVVFAIVRIIKRVLCAVCCVLCAVCYVLCAMCYVLCAMRCALCAVCYVLCAMCYHYCVVSTYKIRSPPHTT